MQLVMQLVEAEGEDHAHCLRYHSGCIAIRVGGDMKAYQVAHELVRDGVSQALGVTDVQQGLHARLEACLLLLQLACTAKHDSFFTAVAHDSQCLAALARWAAAAPDVATSPAATSSCTTGASAVHTSSATCSSSSSSRPAREWRFTAAELQDLRKTALQPADQQAVQDVTPGCMASEEAQGGDAELLAAGLLISCLERPGCGGGIASEALLQVYMRCLAAGAHSLVLRYTRLLLKAGGVQGQADGTLHTPLLLSSPEALSGLLHLALQPVLPRVMVSEPIGAQLAVVEVVAMQQLQGAQPGLWMQLLQLVASGTPAAFGIVRALLSSLQLSEGLVAEPLLQAVLQGAAAAVAGAGLPGLLEVGWVLLPIITSCRPRVSTAPAAAAQCETLLGQVVQALLQQHSSHEEVWRLLQAIISERSCVLTAVPELAAVLAGGLQQACSVYAAGGGDSKLSRALTEVCLQLHGDGACWDLVLADVACVQSVAQAVCSGPATHSGAVNLLLELCDHANGLLGVVNTSQALSMICGNEATAAVWEGVQNADAAVVSAFLRGVAAGEDGHWRLVADVWAVGQAQAAGLDTDSLIAALAAGLPAVRDSWLVCRVLPRLLQEPAFADALQQHGGLQQAMTACIVGAGPLAEPMVVKMLQGPGQRLLVDIPAMLVAVLSACCAFHCFTEGSREAVLWLAAQDKPQQLLLGKAEVMGRCLSCLFVNYKCEGPVILQAGCAALLLLGALPVGQVVPVLVQHLASSDARVVQGALHALYWLNMSEEGAVTQQLQRTVQLAGQAEELQQLTVGLRQAAVELAQQHAGSR